MSILDITDVTVELKDKVVAGPTLQNTLVFDPDTNENSTNTIANLTQRFVSLEDLQTVFPNTTKIQKCADAHYKQPGHQSNFKVGRVTTTDATITDSLDALWDQDKGFFQLITTTKDETKLIEIATWASGKDLLFDASIEPDANKLDSASSTDIASVLAGLNFGNCFLYCHHQAGVDSSSASIVITSEVATITQATHGLRVGDSVTLDTSTEPLANGNHVVSTVVDADNFTYAVPGAGNLTTEQIKYFARYSFLESAVQSVFFSGPIGTKKSAYLSLVGQTAVPKTILTDSQIQTLRDKKYNTYISPYNNISITSDGFAVTGRQKKNESVAVWVDLNMEAGIFNVQINNDIPFTNEGGGQIRNGITGALDEQLSRGGLNPLNDIEDYLIEMPDALSAPTTDRDDGIWPPIFVTVRIGSEVLKVKVNVIALV